jgi:hypothetical protein
MIPEDLDDDARLAFDMMHVSQRLNQALGAELEYQHTGTERQRLGALAELEAVRDEIDAVLADHREGDA